MYYKTSLDFDGYLLLLTFFTIRDMSVCQERNNP